MVPKKADAKIKNWPRSIVTVIASPIAREDARLHVDLTELTETPFSV